MKTPSLKKKFVLFLTVLTSALIVGVGGCGRTDIAPDGSTITITPTSMTLKNTTSDTSNDFTVIVRYPDDKPIPYAKVKISGGFAAPNKGATYQFYYYTGGSANTGNAAVDSGFIGQTDKMGIYKFSVVVYGASTGFDDTIMVESGTASATATLSLSFD